MKKYIELTEYDSNGRIVIFADSIQGLYRVHDYDYRKDFTEVLISGYTFAVNEPIDEILEKMESDQGHLDGIEVGYDIAMQKINKARAEILEYRQANMNMEYDKIFELCILIIDKYMIGGEK